jgi:two-component system NtrC family sensor kinase
MFTDPDRIPYAVVIPPVLGFCVLVFLAAVTLLRGRRSPANQLFALLCLLGALNNADLAILSLVAERKAVIAAQRSIYVAFVFSLPVYIQFVHRLLGVARRSWLERTAYLFSLGFLALTPTDLFIRGIHRGAYGFVADAGYAFLAFSLLAGCTLVYCILLLARGLKQATDNRARNRLKYILAGVGLGSLLIGLNILPVVGWNVYPAGSFSFVPAAILAYGVLRYDLMDVGAAIRKGLAYSLLVLILTALYVTGFSLIHALLVRDGPHRVVGTSFLLALLVVVLFQPLRDRVQSFLDGLFFRGRYDARTVIRRLSGELAGVRRSAEIREALFACLAGAIPVEHAFILARKSPAPFFCAHGPDGAAAGIPVLPADHPLVPLLEAAGGPVSRVMLEENVRGTSAAQPVAAFLDASGTDLAVPMLSRHRLLGIIILGQKRSGELFVHEDCELLGTISNQAAIAIESAAGYEEIERMNRDLEQRIEEGTRELRQALEEKDLTRRELIRSESLAAIGQLVAGTAHEINNPLAGASSLLESSLDEFRGRDAGGPVGREVVEDLEFALKELRRAAAIVRSLLDLSRQTRTYSEPVDLHAAVDDALRILSNACKLLPVTIERRYATDLPPVEGNFASLGQVFVNIIKNALEALSGEGGTITITTSTVGAPGNERMSVSVRDTGQGIPAARLADIFKPFFTTKEVGRGTGLGLYISHEIIQQHGGEIHVRSREGRGTEVTVLLPERRKA